MFLQSLLSPHATAAPATAAAAATPAAPATSANQGEPVAVPMAPQPVEDASFAAKLFGKVGTNQNRYLANQQVLGQVTAVLGARLTQSVGNLLRMLKGGPEPTT